MAVQVRRWPTDEILARLDELAVIYADAYSTAPYWLPATDAERLRVRLTEQVSLPGFTFVGSTQDTAVAGFAFGRHFESLQWWYGAQELPPDEVLGAEKFAVSQLVVAPAYQGQGLAARQMTELLRDQGERYATLLSRPDSFARRVYARWGWRPVGSARAVALGPVSEALVVDLPWPGR